MRGFFAPEAVYFNALTWFTGTADLVAQHSIDHLIQGNFITLFACLFGVGFAAQISRPWTRAGRFDSIRAASSSCSLFVIAGSPVSRPSAQ